jgi:ribosomal protein S27AE
MEKQKDFHDLRYMKVCPLCGETFLTDIQHRQACKPCLEKSNPKNVQIMAKALERLGWSDIIDARWKDKVIQHMQIFFDNQMPMVDIYKLLEIVLW